MNILTLISHDTALRRTGAKHGGEYSGPCPFCRLGTDRFKVWPVIGRWACLGREAGRSGCDISGDAIQYLRLKDNLTYAEACERLGLRYWTSAANFVLIDGGTRARAIVAGLIARGVFVRDKSADPSSPNCFRLTAGVVEHTKRAVEAQEAECAAR